MTDQVLDHLVLVSLLGPLLQEKVDHVPTAVVGGHVQGSGPGAVLGLHLHQEPVFH